MNDQVSKPHQDEKPGYGRGRFILGYGKEGVFGHVALFIQFVPEPGFCVVEWRVNSCNFASDARDLVEKATGEYLHKYIAGHPELGLRVAIIDVVSDEIRRNDYERAVNLAFRSALEDIGLPTPQIFSL